MILTPQRSVTTRFRQNYGKTYILEHRNEKSLAEARRHEAQRSRRPGAAEDAESTLLAAERA
jgi:hypothetical protein